jgi:LuxR family transcriptional regulator, maltose regulon positive regulatory protein
VQAIPSPRRERLEMAIAGVRLALTRRAGQLAPMVEQVGRIASPLFDERGEETVRDDDLWAFALMSLGIVETGSGGAVDAECHLSEAAALAEKIGRPYVAAACRAHLGLITARRSFAVAGEHSREAVALAERHRWEDGGVVASALATLGATAIWTGEVNEGERLLSRAWNAVDGSHDPASQALLHATTGMLRLAQGEVGRALEEFEAAQETQTLLPAEHVLAGQISGWTAAAQARAGRPDDARIRLEAAAESRAESTAVRIAWAAIRLAEGDPRAALDALRDVLASATPGIDTSAMVEAHLLDGLAHLALGARREASAAAERALAAAEPDRIILPFVLTASLPLLETHRPHETAHRALLIEIVDVLRGAPVESAAGAAVKMEELSPSELRVLRFLPTNLTRSEIARELYLSVHTVNTHIRNIYSKLGARDRSSAVQHARDRRLLATARSY